MKQNNYLARINRLSPEQRERLATRLGENRSSSVSTQRLAAYIVARPETAPSEQQLRDFLLQQLPEYMVPGIFCFLDTLPQLPNGKVDRKTLASMAPRVNPKPGGVAPRNEVEEKIARIWASVLGAEAVGAHDNFFQLGGHSLLALQVMARLREVFQTEVPLRRLFETPTVAGLAEAVAQSKQGRLTPLIQRVARPAPIAPEGEPNPRAPEPEFTQPHDEAH